MASDIFLILFQLIEKSFYFAFKSLIVIDDRNAFFFVNG